MGHSASLRNRLALLFFAITLLAVGVIYVYVVPRLESSLRDERLQALARTAQSYRSQVGAAVEGDTDARQIDRVVRGIGDAAGVRVTLFLVSPGELGGLQIAVTSDSTDDVGLEGLEFPVALQAARTGRAASGSEASNTGRMGEAAVPIFSRVDGQLVVTHVAAFSEPLSDVQANVSLIRRQIVVAGLIALVLAVAGGFLVARALSRRVERLERAARKVAAGDFSQKIPIERDDELGHLAAAFNDMQRQLAQLDSARKRFIAVASHELRTPLFSVAGFLELIEDEDLDEETRAQFMRQVRDGVDRLQGLATDLLDLSKLEAGSLDLRPEPTDVGDLARAVTQEFTPALARHDSHLTLRLPRRRVEALCDPDRVAQIMRILIANAIAHTPHGTDVDVIASRENGRVKLAVRDRGPGIDRRELERIFEPFYTSDDASGSGLGLAIAKELAERMSGHLDVDSMPGSTVFTLEIPS